jgi:Zn-dependent peptidase ImmA (M78 family)
MNNKISKEIDFLKNYFKLPNLKIVVDKNLYKEHRRRGCYCWLEQKIYIISDKLTRSKLFTILHEICHYLQDIKGLWGCYNVSFSNYWKLEKNAYIFAHKYYKILFEKKYGIYTRSYKKSYLKRKKKLVLDYYNSTFK